MDNDAEKHKDRVEAAHINDGVPMPVFDLLDKLSDAQRLAVFRAYCKECGTILVPCVCWRDE